jgi:hypothetical protein
MKQTAVEWYNSKVIELMTQREQGNIDVLEFRNQLDLLLTEAKEMFEEQMCKFASDYVETQCNASFNGSVSVDITTEEYYNLTFKSE